MSAFWKYGTTVAFDCSEDYEINIRGLDNYRIAVPTANNMESIALALATTILFMFLRPLMRGQKRSVHRIMCLLLEGRDCGLRVELYGRGGY